MLEAQKKEFQHPLGAKDAEAEKLAIAAFQAVYKEHPMLGAHNAGAIFALPSPERITAWLADPSTWEELVEPLGDAGAPILAAECVCMSSERYARQRNIQPLTCTPFLRRAPRARTAFRRARLPVAPQAHSRTAVVQY